MIEPQHEKLISFNECRKWLMSKYGLKRVDLSSIYRWCSRGLSGVRLEYLQVGGKRMTSHEAIARFFQNLTAAKSGCNSTCASKREGANAKGSKGIGSIELELKRRGA